MANTVKDPVREKLEVIAHLGDHLTYKVDIGICYDSELAKVIEDAYMTIKSGVTIPEWISVEDRLPEDGGEVLVYRLSGCDVDCLVSHKKAYWSLDSVCQYPVTHWMPLPQPPKRRMIMGLCESCKNNSCGYASEDVIRCGDFEENIVQTNADRIRAMSDEELVDLIGQRSLCDHIQIVDCNWCIYHNCTDCMQEWLKQPAEVP